jgi:hypothetical protein
LENVATFEAEAQLGEKQREEKVKREDEGTLLRGQRGIDFGVCWRVS